MQKGRWVSTAIIARELEGVHLKGEILAGTLSSAGRKESPEPL